MVKRLLPLALLLLLTSRADASPINLLFTVNMYAPTVPSPPPIRVKFKVFESATYGWPGTIAPEESVVFQQTVLPGITQFTASVDSGSLDHAYFAGGGTYDSYLG